MTEGDSRPTIPFSAILLTIGVLGGALWFQEPYKSLRPEGRRLALAEESISEAPVVARLWQDPFRVVDDYVEDVLEADRRSSEDEPKTRTLPHKHTLAFLQESILRRLEDQVPEPGVDGAEQTEPGESPKAMLQLMAALVPGGDWPVNAEARVRERHAIVSALGHLGYEPDTDKGLGFVRTRWNEVRSAHDPKKDSIELPEDQETVQGQALDIPYEWFTLSAPGRNDGFGRPKHVGVIWIDDSFFGAHTLWGVDLFLQRILDGSVARVQALHEGVLQLSLLGPPSSTSLLAAARWLEDYAPRAEPIAMPSLSTGRLSDSYPEWEERQVHTAALMTRIRRHLPTDFVSDNQATELSEEFADTLESPLVVSFDDTFVRDVQSYVHALLDHEEGMVERLSAVLQGDSEEDMSGFLGAMVDEWQREVIVEVAGDEPAPDPESRRQALEGTWASNRDLLVTAVEGLPLSLAFDIDIDQLGQWGNDLVTTTQEHLDRLGASLLTEEEAQDLFDRVARYMVEEGIDSPDEVPAGRFLLEAVDSPVLAAVLIQFKDPSEVSLPIRFWDEVLLRWKTEALASLMPDTEPALALTQLEQYEEAMERWPGEEQDWLRTIDIGPPEVTLDQLERSISIRSQLMHLFPLADKEVEQLGQIADQTERATWWALLTGMLPDSDRTRPALWNEMLGQLPEYILSDEDVDCPDPTAFSEELVAEMGSTWATPVLPSGPREARGGHWLEWMIQTVEDRRSTLLASEALKHVEWQGPIEFAAQVHFELARWENDLARFVAPLDHRRFALAFHFFLERNLHDGLPPAADRVALLEDVSAEILEYFEYGESYESIRGRTLEFSLKRIVDRLVPMHGDQGLNGLLVDRAIKELVGSLVEEPAASGQEYKYGPVHGTTAVRMAARTRGRLRSALPHLRVYNSHATASIPEEMRVSEESDGWGPYLENVLPEYESLVLSDGMVLKELFRELEARGFRQEDHHLAILTEWDTPYGRALLSEAEEVVGKDNVRAFTYIRGLDGEEPIDGQRKEEEGEKNSPMGKGSGDLKAKVSEIERPEGASQFDYIRRLTTNLARLERDLEQDGDSLFAIGVLGSDVYDKMLVLQAMRERFPSLLFFTTDLDARLLTAENRNLIIASTFGLDLPPRLQGSTPPFRDSYQTATFLACQSALGGIKGLPNGTLPVPKPANSAGQSGSRASNRVFAAEPPSGIEGALDVRIFEVGRQGPIDLSTSDASALYGDRPVVGMRIGTAAGILLALGLAFVLILPYSRRLQAWLFHAEGLDKDECRARNALLVTGGTGLALWFLAIGLDGLEERPEVFSFTGGVSVWPTLLGRVASITLAVYFLFHAHARLSESSREIEGVLGIPEAEPEPLKDGLRRAGTALWNGLRGLQVRDLKAAYLDLHRTASIGGWRRGDVLGKRNTVPGRQVWQEYRGRQSAPSRFLRLLPQGLALAGLVWLLRDGGLSSTSPARGAVARWFDGVTSVISWSIALVLVLYVIDVTRLFERFTRIVSPRQTDWGDEARASLPVRDRGLPREREDDFIDVEVLARHSAVVGQFVLMPFVLLFIFVFSRNTYFDRWTWPTTLLVILGLLALATLIPAFLLRRAAEQARRHALERMRLGEAELGDDSAKHPYLTEPDGKAATVGAVRNRLRLGREEIERNSQGAFSPYTRSPAVQAMLLPFGGAGLVAMLEFFVLMGI